MAKGGSPTVAPGASAGSQQIFKFRNSPLTTAITYREYANGAWQPARAVSNGEGGGQPQATSWGSTHVGVTLRGTDNRVWYSQKNSSTPGAAFSPFLGLGGPRISDDPEIIAWGGSTRVDIFARGDEAPYYGHLMHWWTNDSNSGSWSWESLGPAIQGKPSAVSWNPGHLQVFVRGTDNKLYNKWYTTGSGWSGFTEYAFGSSVTLASDPEAVAWGNGRLDIFARQSGTNNLIQAFYDGTNWGNSWVNLGGVITAAPAAISLGAGHLDVYVRGDNGAVYHRWFGGGNWAPFSSVANLTTDTRGLEVVSWNSQHLDVYGYVGLDVKHSYWTGGAGFSQAEFVL